MCSQLVASHYTDCRTVSRPDTSPTDTSPTDISPNGQFPDRTLLAITLWKFHILNEFFSYLPLKFYLFLKSRQYFMFFIFISKYFNSFLVFNHCISQKVRLNFLLVARCSLLFTRCSLLVTFYSLLVTFCSLLVTFCSLLVNFLLVAHYFLLVAFCSSLLVTFCSFARCLLWNKVTVNRKKNGHVFNYFYVLKESEVVAWKSFMKKVFLNIPQNL